MKYKLLINSKNATFMKDFFLYADTGFECMSTSDIWEDITAHLNLFKPDAYMCCYEQTDDNMLSQIQSIRNNTRYSDVHLIIVGDAESCSVFGKKLPFVTALTVKKPISIQDMEQSIRRYLREKVKEPPAKPAVSPVYSAEEPASVPSATETLGMSLDDLKKSFAGVKPKKHILIVDDDKNVLKMLKAALESEYDITTVVNGKLAERFLETKTADLILLDYEMPVVSGPEIFAKIKNDPKTHKIPVVFLTGVAESGKIKEVLALKPRGYLLKPINMERLLSSIKEILD